MTTETKHTPGPWQIKYYPNCKGFSINASGFCIAERWFDIPPSEARLAEIKANATFIVEACNEFDSVKAERQETQDYLLEVITQRDKLAAVLSKLLFHSAAINGAAAWETVKEDARAALAKHDENRQIHVSSTKGES